MTFAKGSAIIKSCSQDYPDVTFSDMIETSNNFLKMFRKNTAVDKVELISLSSEPKRAYAQKFQDYAFFLFKESFILLNSKSADLFFTWLD